MNETIDSPHGYWFSNRGWARCACGETLRIDGHAIRVPVGIIAAGKAQKRHQNEVAGRNLRRVADAMIAAEATR